MIDFILDLDTVFYYDSKRRLLNGSREKNSSRIFNDIIFNSSINVITCNYKQFCNN